MKKRVGIGVVLVAVLLVVGCGVSVSPVRDQIAPAFTIKPNEPIAVMPFETESALSNLGGQVSDEVIVNLLEHAPQMKIIPATVVRSFLASVSINANGLPDAHTVHSLQEGLKCRYLLTGNLFTSIGEVRYTQTYSVRVASGTLTVRLVDCDSNIVIWAKHEDATYSATTYYYSGGQQQTSYVTDGQLLQELLRKLGYQAARNFYRHE